MGAVHRVRVLLVFPALTAIPLPVWAQAPQLLFQETFEPRADLAPVAAGRAAREQRAAPKRAPRLIPAPHDSHLSLVAGAGPDGSTALQVRYVGNTKGSERVAINLPLRRAVSRARLSFDVRFAPDFDFRSGGKLLGLAPLRPVTGGALRRPDGWSARLSFQPQGAVATYLYDQAVTLRRFGVGQKSAEPVFQPGTWHHVSLDLQLNEPGAANGSVLIHVDGVPVVAANGLMLRGTGGAETLIQKLLFHTFHGGSDASYTPRDAEGRPTTVSALFDNILVTSNQP
jgi:hypothetical protein